MDDLRFAFFGATNYSKELLIDLIEKNFMPAAIFSIPKEFNISYSNEKVINTNFSNLKKIANEKSIPYYEIDSIEGAKTKDYNEIIKGLNLDLILALGWYYMIPKTIRELSKFGAWGIHASLLPKYAGGAPLNWAIINGEEETGVTLFRIADGVDDGDIIAQKSFSIEYEDNISDIYSKATIASKEILCNILKNVDNVSFQSQDKNKIEIYPQRKPSDGEIDFSKNSKELYNFIRAQSYPYPGAFITTSDGKKLVIEKARIED